MIFYEYFRFNCQLLSVYKVPVIGINWFKGGEFMEDCIFCKIIKGEIPSNKIYEDDKVYAFNDINPEAPVHLSLIHIL